MSPFTTYLVTPSLFWKRNFVTLSPFVQPLHQRTFNFLHPKAKISRFQKPQILTFPICYFLSFKFFFSFKIWNLKKTSWHELGGWIEHQIKFLDKPFRMFVALKQPNFTTMTLVYLHWNTFSQISLSQGDNTKPILKTDLLSTQLSRGQLIVHPNNLFNSIAVQRQT